VATGAPAAVEKTDAQTPAMALAACGDALPRAGSQPGLLSAPGKGSHCLPPLDRIIWFLHLII
jgi:hypothetical protein